jgi:hypothetical protein
MQLMGIPLTNMFTHKITKELNFRIKKLGKRKIVVFPIMVLQCILLHDARKYAHMPIFIKTK